MSSNSSATISNLNSIRDVAALYRPNVRCWVESFKSGEKQKLLQLDSQIFHNHPRLDILYWNIDWQKRYRTISMKYEMSRAEMKGGGRKPWPQPCGRARAGSIRSPLFMTGGSGRPRGPRADFFIPNNFTRLEGLKSALSVKFFQNKFTLVDKISAKNYDHFDEKILKNQIKKRSWGYSNLLISENDLIERPLYNSISRVKGCHIMPFYSVNVWSLLKFEHIIVSEKAIKLIQEKLKSRSESLEVRNYSSDEYRNMYTPG
ncbi:MAG: 54S ribosomal protein L4 mitochondrial [Marteilia pararefringens]